MVFFTVMLLAAASFLHVSVCAPQGCKLGTPKPKVRKSAAWLEQAIFEKYKPQSAAESPDTKF